MTKALIWPTYVQAALDSVEGCGPEALRTAVAITGRSAPGFILEEALVRLVRRARVDGEDKAEAIAMDALLGRVEAWSMRTYSSLSPLDAEEMSVVLGTHVIEAVLGHDAIDYWEITFLRNLQRAAADLYRHYHREKFAKELVEFDMEFHGDDAGTAANRLRDEALVLGIAAILLEPRDLPFVQPLLLSGMPLRSPRASTDLVRTLGKPEGTLREIKTRIMARLRGTSEEQNDGQR